MSLHYEILIIVFTLLSFFFSGAETSILSANRMKIRSMSEKGNARAGRALFIIDNIENYIGMILIGNNIVNMSSAAFIIFMASGLFVLSDRNVFIITAIQTVVFLILCEILPKTIARSKPDGFLMFFSYPLMALMYLFGPLSKFSLLLTGVVKRSLHLELKSNSLVRSRDEIGALFHLGESEGIIDKNHQILVDEILSLHEITAHEVMTPTIDIVSVEKKETVRRVAKIISGTRFSRIPVYEDRVDNITGYVYYRDLLKKRNIKSVEGIVRKPYYVPTTKKIDDLFHEMQEGELPVTFVVNEYGAVVGMITIEDIVEEVVGEIQTRDHQHQDLIREINSRRYVVAGSIDIDYFQMRFGLKIEKKGFETLAGFMNYKFGRIPEKGARIRFEGRTLIAAEVTEKSVESVIVIIPK
jgi:putative hemolysin